MNNPGMSSRIIVVAGTYDGVLAGWDTLAHNRNGKGDTPPNEKQNKKKKSGDGILNLSFAMAAHEGSVRCLAISSSTSIHSKSNNSYHKERNEDKSNFMECQPGLLLSGGFDEALRVYDLKKHAEAGETKTPQDLGTPTCACFAPPVENPTHCLVGLTSGKIVLYKKKDWSIAHILGGGHSSKGTTTGEGVSCVAVHPTGKMALSSGVKDSKICLWDLMKGRLAYIHKVSTVTKQRDRVASLAWSHDGSRYAFCHGKKLTARDAISGEDLLDIELPSRINQICFLFGGEAKDLYYLACACDDGSLPVLAVGAVKIKENDGQGMIRAVMAIEPVDKNIAGVDRIKCIQSLRDAYLVVTANSTGVISILNLSGAVQMILEENHDPDQAETNETDVKEEDDYQNSDLLAVEFLDSVRVGSGARITTIACWSSEDALSRKNRDLNGNSDFLGEETNAKNHDQTPTHHDNEQNNHGTEMVESETNTSRKRKHFNINVNKERIKLDDEDVAKARDLIKKAKKRQKNKKGKKGKTNEGKTLNPIT